MKHSAILRKVTGTTILLGALIVVVASAYVRNAAAQPAPRSPAPIVGSWKLVVDGTGDVFFGTYNGGPTQGTVNFSSPDNSISLTHGTWRRTGPRTFADTDSGFIYDANGIASLIITFRAEVEVAPDGDTASFNFAFEVSLFDGTVVDSGAGTGIGTRIKVQPLAAP